MKTTVRILTTIWGVLTWIGILPAFDPAIGSDPSPGGERPYIIVLGITQDGGYPHAGCTKACCRDAWSDCGLHRLVSCLGIVDPLTGGKWMIDATPDFKIQNHRLREAAPTGTQTVPTGIFLTHAHVGHYAGLIHLGREIMSTSDIPVYAMPGMSAFLKSNAPWNGLLQFKNIRLLPLLPQTAVILGSRLRVVPIPVPHRDEYSETVGFEISSERKSILYLPDIDRWQHWNKKIVEQVRRYDALLLDGTFFSGDELPDRNMEDIPHPCVQESLKLFAALPMRERRKIMFIHFNHSNPLLRPASPEQTQLENLGFRCAREGAVIGL